MNREAAKGFTLIEMSIVLVIIGLIAGGILAGRELVRSAELKSVIIDINKFITATHTFRTKYNALPGDMIDATTYWGADASCPGTPTNTVPKQATCNGNGNGMIDPWPSSQDYEEERFFQQLANAGLIPGAYTGVANASGFWTFGVTSPASRISNAGYMIEFNPNFGLPEYMPGYGHFIYLGAPFPGDIPEGAAISPGDAYSIDSKMDDGLPALGNVMSFGTTANPSCTNNAAYPTEKYNLAKTTILCSLMFKMPF